MAQEDLVHIALTERGDRPKLPAVFRRPSQKYCLRDGVDPDEETVATDKRRAVHRAVVGWPLQPRVEIVDFHGRQSYTTLGDGRRPSLVWLPAPATSRFRGDHLAREWQVGEGIGPSLDVQPKIWGAPRLFVKAD